MADCFVHVHVGNSCKIALLNLHGLYLALYKSIQDQFKA